MRYFRSLRWAVALSILTASCYASDITGTVTNKTNDKPSAGDDVVLLKLSQGMQEAARTKTDSHGKFKLSAPDDGAQHLVRVNHQGVNYFKPAPVGTTVADVEVYDSGKQVPGVAGRADIVRVQADSNQMNVTELFVIQNDSKPPRTQMSDRSFEITLPQDANIDSSLAAGPGGMPVNSAPVPTESKGRYAYIFPLRPGETRFQISYHTPYSGSFSFQPQILMPMEDMVVMLPKSMEFKPGSGDFASGGVENGMSIYVAHNVDAGKQLAYSVSGTGEIPRDAQNQGDGAQQQSSSAEADNRPGGGLGKPEDTPDPLHAYRWWILGGLGAALVVGAIVVMNQKPRNGLVVSPATQTGNPAGGHRNVLQEALKEELFQLETDRLQGKISAADYQQAKSALEITIKRAISRN
ncbi:MAG TPA: carboxypeptidase regulatory-like domain-containing protein [Terriglobales bacterium]|nr:carboxypeptidase regulatory-like domain-containing protein [Terriglobales bacterium]